LTKVENGQITKLWVVQVAISSLFENFKQKMVEIVSQSIKNPCSKQKSCLFVISATWLSNSILHLLKQAVFKVKSMVIISKA